MHISASAYDYMCVHVCVWVHVCVRVCEHVSVRTSMLVFACVSTFAWHCKFLCESVWESKCECVNSYAKGVRETVLVRVYVFACTCVRVCWFVLGCACVCACAPASVVMRFWFNFWFLIKATSSSSWSTNDLQAKPSSSWHKKMSTVSAVESREVLHVSRKEPATAKHPWLPPLPSNSDA